MGADHMPNNVADILDLLTPDYPEVVVSHAVSAQNGSSRMYAYFCKRNQF